MVKSICKHLFALSGLHLSTLNALPLRLDPIIVGENGVVNLAEQPEHRTAAVAVCISFALLLASAQGKSYLSKSLFQRVSHTD